MPIAADTQKSLQLRFGGYSSAGIKAENQDAFVAHFPPGNAGYLKGGVACMADGVSCSDSAQLASQTSVTTFVEDYFSTPDAWPVKTAAARVLSSLNSWLYQHGQSGSARHNGLVTTFSAVIFKSTTAHILHVGDSRLYRYRSHSLGADFEQLSRDHCHQQGGDKAFLTRALGMDSHLEVDYQQEDLQVGDVFLLSTDGVHDALANATLKSFLARACELPHEDSQQSSQLEALCGEMGAAALAGGSEDNISALIIRVVSLPDEDIDEVHRKLTQLTIPPALSVGMKIDAYEIQRVLHSGTRSHVYLAKNIEDQTLCVLKAPSENYQDDVEFLEAFVREQWVGRRINHPGVMKIINKPNSRFMYHACEYLEGKTLRQWIYDNPQPSFEKVRHITAEIVSALRAFQRLSMVHRDLKPENIILSPEGGVKIIDFGTVQVSGLDEIASPVSESGPVGAVDYIAPEYLLGEKGQHRSDIFSLGVIVYEMLTGVLPYQSPRVQRASVRSYDIWQYQSALTQRNDIPSWIDLALQKATAPSPTHRYSALSEFLQDLKTPNHGMLSQLESAPLLERDPVSFWKLISALLFVCLLIQFYFMNSGL